MKVLEDNNNVFSTENTSLYQDDSFRGFVLKVADQTYYLDRYGYSFLKKRIKALNLIALLSSKTPDIEVIRLLNSDSFLIVDIPLAIELKDLMAGATAMFELNTCIHKEIHRKSIHA